MEGALPPPVLAPATAVPGPQVDLLRCAVLRACHADVEALKPGNVAIGAPAHGMCADDFLRSAEAVVQPLTDQRLALGERIEAAVTASVAAAGCNTNLGIVLLLAPMTAAALAAASAGDPPQVWRRHLPRLLSATTAADGAAAARAIVRAAPAGLGSVAEADVAAGGSRQRDFHHTLHEAMALAAGRDQIARQYVSDFATVHEMAAHLSRLLAAGANREDAVTAVFLHRLAHEPDTHIARKHGPQMALQVMREAGAVQAGLSEPPGWTPADVRRLVGLHDSLLARRLNPGTGADLIVAAVFATELDAMQNF